MQVAVLSDIHSNYRALEAVLAECEKRQIKDYLFLGDYVTDCAYPRKTMELLRETERRWNCKFIRGNREEYLLRHRVSGENGWQKGSANGALHLSAVAGRGFCMDGNFGFSGDAVL